MFYADKKDKFASNMYQRSSKNVVPDAVDALMSDSRRRRSVTSNSA